MRRTLALIAVPLLFAASACGDDSSPSSTATTGSSTTPSTPPSTDLEAIEVTLADGKPPTADFTAPFTVEQTEVKVLDEGAGPTSASGSTILADYVGYNGNTMKEFDNSYDRGSPQMFALTEGQMLPGIITGLVGQKAGSTVLMAIPSAEAFGDAGSQQAGISPTDTIVFVMTIRQVSEPEPLPIADGEQAALPSTVPSLDLNEQGQPTGFAASGEETKDPTELGVYTPVQGSGEEVEKGDLLTIQYIGQIYPDGEIFDESWSKGPVTFQIGVGALIEGWDKGLVGLKTGSRVVLVIPPDLGYGASGQPDAGIKGTDTLIFVIDILGVGQE